ncbi:hypothetical protein GCM10027290_05810 [Micromonospora sonneratiae]|uniref:GNAT family N-acetyltransferase n=1 Tax=Micromonospora sonneratiae TaxID=1184706 RepID=A0ABW3Y9Z3_9ACTN
MKVVPATTDRIPDVETLLALGKPYIKLRVSSDYWLYAKLFSTTCPVAVPDGEVVGCVIARSLVGDVRRQAFRWGCRCLYLTSEPDNRPAHDAWLPLGFVNTDGDRWADGVSVIFDYKGLGKQRAVYECRVGS